MALPFFDGGTKKKLDQILAVDLGSRTTKAVHLQRRGGGFVLSRYALVDAPIFDKVLSVEILTEHLKQVSQALEAKTRSVALSVGVNDAIVRQIELPRIPVEEMRMVLRLNSRNYLQQDLPNYIFDCNIVERSAAKPDAKPATGVTKQKVLVAGAKRQLVEDFIEGAKSAGLSPEAIIPGLIGPVNAFELALPEVFAKETVALVDIGFKSSSICILQNGELILSRVMGIGGDRLTTALSESMNISYAEAEGIKVGMAGEVQSSLDSVLTPLGRELRASIDFFEHQQDKPVTQALISGGSARSELIMKSLQAELMVECKTWNPGSFLQLALPPSQASEFETVAPQLSVALGMGVTAI